MKHTIDKIDILRNDWKKQQPNLDTSAMDIVGRIIILGEGYHKSANLMLKKYALGYTDFDVLATIRRSGKPYSLRPADLLNSILIQSGSLTTCIDRLEKLGFVRRKRLSKDRRSLMVSLTVKGIKIVDQAAEARFLEAIEHTEHLTKNEQQTFINLLRKLKT